MYVGGFEALCWGRGQVRVRLWFFGQVRVCDLRPARVITAGSEESTSDEITRRSQYVV